jgi:hypothetical protein
LSLSKGLLLVWLLLAVLAFIVVRLVLSTFTT